METKNENGLFAKIKLLFKKKNEFWLFSKKPDTSSKFKIFSYVIFSLLAVLASSAVLSCGSLTLAMGPAYPAEIFSGYFENAYLVVLNFLPPLIMFLFLYAVIGKSWLAYLIDSGLVLSLSFVNFFFLKFRDDPLMFMDVMYVREGAHISKTGYEYEITDKMWVCIALCLLCTLLLFLFQRYTPDWRVRLCALTVIAAVVFFLKGVYFSTDIYDKKTKNNEHINVWVPTQVFVSKGYMYPFFHSMKDAFDVPDGYDKSETIKELSAYETKPIAEEKKVNVISIMLEAYSDLGTLGIEGINDEAYSLYHKLKEENYSGTLVTNIFAAGTIDSERAFLTGYQGMNNFRHDVNSYARFFASNGYSIVGSHPSEEWFYNRKNINEYLGFEEYRFIDNYFKKAYDPLYMRNDNVVFDDFYNQYVETFEKDNKPYFSFHLNYQGHAPYSKDSRIWGTDENPLYVNDGVSDEACNIINNYLGTMRNTTENICEFVEKINQRPEPVVIVLFGDHKPWLGDGGSVYKELGISTDCSTKQGFLNYYSTEYVIVANDAAKKALSNDFKGKGPMTSPCYLMNVLFNELDIEGPAYMQYTNEIMKKLPVVNDVGAIDSQGNFYTVSDMPDDIKSLYDKLHSAAYYTMTHFEE